MDLKGFIGGSYTSQSPIADDELTINWYTETQEVPGSLPALYPCPGVETIGSGLTNVGGRGHFAIDGREFAVIGTDFLEIDINGSPTSRGTVAIDNHPATICSNGKAGNQLFITSGTNGYIFTMSTNAFAQVAALNGKATMGDQLDGYFLALNTVTGTWYFSNLNDGLTWTTGTNFINRSIASDSWISLKVANRYIWLFGSETSEIWYDAGTFPRPFAPYVSSVIPYGCAAIFSPAVTNGVISWVGSSVDGQGQILQTPGTSPTVISTFALSNKLNGFSTLADGIGDTYTSRGHTFYRVDFDTAQSSLVYDLNSQLWHDRGTWIAEENRYVAWRPRFHVFAFGEHRLIDSVTNELYRMSEDIFTDVDERPIRRLRRTPMLFNENERIYINSLELNAEVGLGRTPQNPISEIYGITRSFWNLDEETGDRLDVFGLNDLSPNIGPTAQPGIINNAVNLVRSSLQSVSITDAAQTDLNPGLSDLSISTWIFPVIMTGVANYYIIGKGCDANSSPEQTGYAIYLNGTGTSTASRISVLFGAPPATAIGGFVTFDAVISPSVWTHLVVTFDRAGVISLYVNGALITAVSAGSRTIDSLGDNSGQCDTIAPFVIGGNSSTAGLGIQTFDGRIDATGVFPVVLNQQQVSMLYNGGVGVQLNSALIGTWLQNDGSDPQVMMRLSNDGGKTWGLERWRGAGKTGEYNKRIVWYRLGQGRKRVFEISTTDNIPWRLLGASIDLRPSTLIKQAG